MSLRSKVIQLYKTLIYLGKDYSGDSQKFCKKVHDVFMEHANETDPKKIKQLLAQGRYVTKELEALYTLKKYRAMKKRYEDK